MSTKSPLPIILSTFLLNFIIAWHDPVVRPRILAYSASSPALSSWWINAYRLSPGAALESIWVPTKHVYDTPIKQSVAHRCPLVSYGLIDNINLRPAITVYVDTKTLLNITGWCLNKIYPGITWLILMLHTFGPQGVNFETTHIQG